MPLNLPPELTNKAVSAITQLAFKFIEGRITAARFDRVDSHDAPAKPCTTCLIHQHVVLARGYIEGLHTRLHADGSVPEGLGGTIKQAQDHLKEAMMEIPSVVGAHPGIDSACSKLAELLPDCVARLEYVNGMDEWEIVLSKLKLAEDVAYAIPEAMYRREPAQVSAPRETIVVLTSEDKEVLDLIGDIRRGEISESDAKSRLNQLLSTGETHD